MAQYDAHNAARAKFSKPTLLPAALGHHTAATRTLFGLATGAARSLLSGRRRRKHHRRAAAAGIHKRRRIAKHGRRRKAHLVKGSAAARKHMARIRKLRGRKAG